MLQSLGQFEYGSSGLRYHLENYLGGGGKGDGTVDIILATLARQTEFNPLKEGMN